MQTNFIVYYLCIINFSQEAHDILSITRTHILLSNLNCLYGFTITLKNKPEGLKVAKEDQRFIGFMVDRLDSQ